MTYLEKINALSPEVIEDFRNTGKSEGIGEDLQEYIRHLSAAAEILQHEGNVTTAAKKLKQRYTSISLRTAKGRIYDAIAFFNVDANLSASVWANYYADRYEDLFRYCIGADKENAAFRALTKAQELRMQASSTLNPTQVKPPIFIISGELTPQQLGYENKHMYEIGRKHEEGQYLKFIDSLSVSDKEKARLKKDAGLQAEDVPFEEEVSHESH